VPSFVTLRLRLPRRARYAFDLPYTPYGSAELP
jgi:hypothetical protein